MELGVITQEVHWEVSQLWQAWDIKAAECWGGGKTPFSNRCTYLTSRQHQSKKILANSRSRRASLIYVKCYQLSIK